jgi:DHA2 family multidrug resistance protein
MPQHRAEGAGLFTLIRNIGSAAGISIMQALFVSGIEKHHAAGRARPARQPAVPGLCAPGLRHRSPPWPRFNAVITRQAAMLSYLDDFQLMLGITIPARR